MANTNAPFGARFIKSLQPNCLTGGINTYTVPATDSTAIFLGDFVTHQGTSAIGANGQYLPVIAQSAAADKVTGIVIGFNPDRDYESQVYRTASTLRDVLVLDDPYAKFELQASNGTFAVTMVGQNMDIAVAAGSTVTGLSGMTADVGTVAGTATLPVRIVGISNRENNEIGAYTVLECIMNYTTNKDTTGV